MRLETTEFQELIKNIESSELGLTTVLKALRAGEIYRKALIARAPFNVGDRVILIDTPVITPTESWGWMGSKHFLVKGAKGVVKEIDFYDGTFTAGVHFDDETWIDSNNVLRLPSAKHEYWFKERWLLKI